MVDWLKRTTNIRHYDDTKTTVEHFQFKRVVVAGESRLYLTRYESRFVPERHIGRTLTTVTLENTSVTYKWEFHEPVSGNLSLEIDP